MRDSFSRDCSLFPDQNRACAETEKKGFDPMRARRVYSKNAIRMRC